MLIEQRRRPAHPHGSQRKAHRRARRQVFADHRMIDLLQPLALAILLAVDELADGVERRRGQVTCLGLVGEIVSVELADKFRKGFGDCFGHVDRGSGDFPTRDRQDTCRSSSSARTPSTYAACWS